MEFFLIEIINELSLYKLYLEGIYMNYKQKTDKFIFLIFDFIALYQQLIQIY